MYSLFVNRNENTSSDAALPSRLASRIEAVYTSRHIDPRLYSPERYVHFGHEVLEAGAAYYWDGLRRGADALRPSFVFQYTLSGWGVYEGIGQKTVVGPDHAFAATLPSAHRYYLPPESPGWNYFWFMVRHPYVVTRMIELKRRHGATFDLSGNDAAALRAVRLFEGMAQSGFRDTFAEELALFDLLFELERFSHNWAFPGHEREEILEAVRRYVRSNIRRQVDVEEIARLYGMSRSHFGHHFRSLTGESPAGYIRKIRLEEASQYLVNSNARLEDVAAETGFANANDLCKVFRRHFEITPGEFRKQMRVG